MPSYSTKYLKHQVKKHGYEKTFENLEKPVEEMFGLKFDSFSNAKEFYQLSDQQKTAYQQAQGYARWYRQVEPWFKAHVPVAGSMKHKSYLNPEETVTTWSFQGAEAIKTPSVVLINLNTSPGNVEYPQLPGLKLLNHQCGCVMCHQLTGVGVQMGLSHVGLKFITSLGKLDGCLMWPTLEDLNAWRKKLKKHGLTGNYQETYRLLEEGSYPLDPTVENLEKISDLESKHYSTALKILTEPKVVTRKTLFSIQNWQLIICTENCD